MAWERRGPFLVIGIPHQGRVNMEWAVALARLQKPPNTIFTFNRGAPIDVAREKIAETVFEHGAEWLLFLDSDVIPPEDGLMRLLSYDVPIISGLYYRRHREGGRPFHPAMWRLVPKGAEVRCPECGRARTWREGKYVPIMQWEGDLVEADAIGLGFCLIHRSVLETVEREVGRPWFLWTHGREELFNLEVGVSEDFFFAEKVREAGYRILVATSVRCGHVGELVVEADGGVRSPRV